jgi:hypothetical protein
MADCDDAGIVSACCAFALEPGAEGRRIPTRSPRGSRTLCTARAWLRGMQNLTADGRRSCGACPTASGSDALPAPIEPRRPIPIAALKTLWDAPPELGDPLPRISPRA